MRLNDKVCVITGAGYGIGRAAATVFAKEGAKVVVADIDDYRGSETVSLVKKAGGEAIFVKVDIVSSAQVESLVKTAITKYGKLDVLYNNAAIVNPQDKMVENLSQDVWDKIINVNVKGTFLTCKYAIPELIRNGGGSIINTASYVAFASYEVPAYCASKGAVVAFTRAVARQYAKKHIRCNALCPGSVSGTHQNEQRSQQIVDPAFTLEFPRSLNLIDRNAEPNEIAYLAVYLASDESMYATGSAFIIDGGMTSM